MVGERTRASTPVRLRRALSAVALLVSASACDTDGGVPASSDALGESPVDRARPRLSVITPIRDSVGAVASNAFRSPLGGDLATWASGRWHAVLLDDGRVLVLNEVGTPEIFDPACETFSSTGAMVVARTRFRATKLLDGRVLVTGGRDGDNVLQSSTEIFDPTSESFAAGPSMTEPRETHTATLLDDGRVLVVGGDTAEIFDPSTVAFAATSPPTETRNDHDAARLADGRVLVAGGLHPGSAGGGARGDAEVFDPSTDTFAVTGDLAAGRASHRLTLLLDGTVLVTGGHTSGVLMSEVEIYQPASGAFTIVGSLTDGRGSQTTTLLDDGRALVAGGVTGPLPADFAIIDGAMLYDPSTSSLTPTAAPMGSARWRHGAARLQNGRVLIVGGTNSASASPRAELFVP